MQIDDRQHHRPIDAGVDQEVGQVVDQPQRVGVLDARPIAVAGEFGNQAGEVLPIAAHQLALRPDQRDHLAQELDHRSVGRRELFVAARLRVGHTRQLAAHLPLAQQAALADARRPSEQQERLTRLAGLQLLQHSR